MSNRISSSVFFCDLRQLIERRATRAEFRAFVDKAERKVEDAVEAEQKTLNSWCDEQREIAVAMQEFDRAGAMKDMQDEIQARSKEG